jgi:hypothetical protein
MKVKMNFKIMMMENRLKEEIWILMLLLSLRLRERLMICIRPRNKIKNEVNYSKTTNNDLNLFLMILIQINNLLK